MVSLCRENLGKIPKNSMIFENKGNGLDSTGLVAKLGKMMNYVKDKFKRAVARNIIPSCRLKLQATIWYNNFFENCKEIWPELLLEEKRRGH